MHPSGGAPKDFDGHAGKPLEEIEAVDGLVHGRTAAVERERAFPPLVVIRSAIPLHVGAREHEAAESSGIQRGFDELRAVAETRLKDRRDDHACFLGGGEKLIHSFDGDLEGFLDHEMFACFDRGEGGFEMGTARGGDADDLDIIASHESFDICGVKGCAVFFSESGHGLGIASRDASEASASRIVDGEGVIIRDHAAANNPKTKVRRSRHMVMMKRTFSL